MGASEQIDELIRSSRWGAVIAALRGVLRGAGLSEAVKWRQPCYTHGGRNIAIIQPMAQWVALMFFKGALLDDPHRLLEPPGPNSHAGRRVRCTSVEEVERLAPAITRWVAQAIALEEEGAELPPAPPPELPTELEERLAEDPALRAAFDALTPGRRREYQLYVAAAKKPETRRARVERCVPRILAGRGLRDR